MFVFIARSQNASGTTIANSEDRSQRLSILDVEENVNLIDQIQINIIERYAESQFFLSGDADFLADHFPGTPILPGLIMLEIAAQTASAWMTENDKTHEQVVFDIDFLEQLYITRRVVPNETLSMKVMVAELSTDRLTGFFNAEAKVMNKRAMRAKFSLVPVKKKLF